MGIAHPTLQALLIIIMGWLDLCRPRCYAHLITFRQTRKATDKPRKNKASLPIPILRLISGVKRLIINDAVLGRYWAARHAGGAYNGPMGLPSDGCSGIWRGEVGKDANLPMVFLAVAVAS